MAFYQVKIKGREIEHRMIRASSIEEAIKDVLRSEESLKESIKERYRPIEIEDVKLFWDKDDPVKMIEEETTDLFRGIKDLGEIGFLWSDDNFDYHELKTLLRAIDRKIERADSLLSAYFDFTENNTSLLKEK